MEDVPRRGRKRRKKIIDGWTLKGRLGKRGEKWMR